MIQIPTPPQPGASEAERLSFDDACRVADLALRAEALAQAIAANDIRESHAQAQFSTANAMFSSVEAQRGFTAAMREPDPLPPLADQKRAAVIQLLSTQARGNRKPATFVADVQAQVDAVFAVLAGGAA
jgi:hypothetical protein